MKMPKLLPELLPKLLGAVAAAALLGGCEARIGNDAPPVDANASAAGRAEEGRLTVEAPGFNLSIDIPEVVDARARIDEESGVVYPGSRFGGIHIQGRGERDGGAGDGEVEMRLTHADPPERVAAWYRDPARSADLRVATEERRGEAYVISGVVLSDNDRFTATIAPRAGGGSETRLVLGDSGR